jgi:pSer/pThr/pTyr-binding forkhead associated (FHA) protein
MDQCPQCKTERTPGEIFCDNCGHKYAISSESTPQTQSSSKESQSFEDYEKDYLNRISTDESQPETTNNNPIRGVILIPTANNSGEETIHFDESPKTVGRENVSEVLKSRNADPLQVSRKQFTIFKESDEYYLEDGKTSIQDTPSGNHTMVNGIDITGKGKIKLNNNDVIGMATVLDVTFRLV